MGRCARKRAGDGGGGADRAPRCRRSVRPGASARLVARDAPADKSSPLNAAATAGSPLAEPLWLMNLRMLVRERRSLACDVGHGAQAKATWLAVEVAGAHRRHAGGACGGGGRARGAFGGGGLPLPPRPPSPS